MLFKTCEEPIDPLMFRRACGQFATGIVVITTENDGQVMGMTANAFVSLSLEPQLVGVSIAQAARILPNIQHFGYFGVSVLDSSDAKVANHFAGMSSEKVDVRFKSLDGVPVLETAKTCFATRLTQSVQTGDHLLCVGEVMAIDHAQGVQPLIYHRGAFAELTHPCT